MKRPDSSPGQAPLPRGHRSPPGERSSNVGPPPRTTRFEPSSNVFGPSARIDQSGFAPLEREQRSLLMDDIGEHSRGRVALYITGRDARLYKWSKNAVRAQIQARRRAVGDNRERVDIAAADPNIRFFEGKVSALAPEGDFGELSSGRGNTPYVWAAETMLQRSNQAPDSEHVAFFGKDDDSVLVAYLAPDPRNDKGKTVVTTMMPTNTAHQLALAMTHDPTLTPQVANKLIKDLGYKQNWIDKNARIPVTSTGGQIVYDTSDIVYDASDGLPREGGPRSTSMPLDRDEWSEGLQRLPDMDDSLGDRIKSMRDDRLQAADSADGEIRNGEESSETRHGRRLGGLLRKARETGIDIFGKIKDEVRSRTTRDEMDERVLRLKEIIHGKEDASKTEKVLRMAGALGVSALVGAGVTLMGAPLAVGGAAAGVLVGSKAYLGSNARIIKNKREDARFISGNDHEKGELNKEVRKARVIALGKSALIGATVAALPFAGDAIEYAANTANPLIEAVQSIGDTADSAPSDAPAPSTDLSASPEAPATSAAPAPTTELPPPPSEAPAPSSAEVPAPAPEVPPAPQPEVPAPGPVDASTPPNWSTAVESGDSLWSKLAEAGLSDPEIDTLIDNNPGLTQELVGTEAFFEQADGTPGLRIDATPEQMQEAWDIINKYR